MATENTQMIIDNVDALQARMKEMRKAQQVFATYTQEQVDKIFFAAAMAANKARIPLAKMAVQETGMGVVEDKVIKNHYASEYIYNAYRDTKTCGVIEEDKAYGIKKIAEPIGRNDRCNQTDRFCNLFDTVCFVFLMTPQVLVSR